MNNVQFCFPSPIYIFEKPEFLSVVSKVSEEALSKINHEPDEIYPMFHSGNYANDQRLADFCRFLCESGWNILKEQGYAMNNFGVFVESAWTQKHYKHSLMEQHVHAGPQLVGFYFLEIPEGSSRPQFHDPRPGKVQNFLPEEDSQKATLASNTLNFEPKSGMFIISNSWVPHSFSRHASNEPLKFVHFNLNVIFNNFDPNVNRTTCQSGVAFEQKTSCIEII